MTALVIVIRGTGDVATAAAHALFMQGHHVVCQDVSSPTYSRRGMAFVDALFDGTSTVSGVTARLADDFINCALMLGCGKAVPVTTIDFEGLLQTLHPDVIVDARMRKRSVPESLIGRAPLTIGLGPNFIAGETVDIAIETSWGNDLGQVIKAGRTRDLGGEPRPIEGVGRERFIYAPHAGLFRTDREIGELVEKHALVATLDGEALCAPLSGCIRGLTRDGLLVDKGTKIVEIDPRGKYEAVFGLGERPKRIATGVLQAVLCGGVAAARVFRFETCFEATLECIPMKARFNLDACGIKVSLELWRRLPLSARQYFLAMPVDDERQVSLCRAFVSEVIARYSGETAQLLPSQASPWTDVTTMPIPIVPAQFDGILAV